MVVENVKGAQKWVGRSRWNYGSFHLWGDVPALMPMARKMRSTKLPEGNCSERLWSDRPIQRLCDATKNNGGSWSAIGSPGQTNLRQNPVNEMAGTKGFAARFEDTPMARLGSKSKARKAASAMIAKIPLPLRKVYNLCDSEMIDDALADRVDAAIDAAIRGKS